MNSVKFAAALLIAASPVAVYAQDAAAPAPAAPPATAAPSNNAAADVVPGATVYDTQGNPVGVILKTDGTNAVVDTGTHHATLAVSGFAKGSAGPVVGMTKAQLNTAIETAQRETDAKLATALTPGAVVKSSDQMEVGTIKEIDAGGNVILELAAGPVALPKNQFTAGPDGGAALRFTKAQLDAALAKQAPAAPAG